MQWRKERCRCFLLLNPQRYLISEHTQIDIREQKENSSVHLFIHLNRDSMVYSNAASQGTFFKEYSFKSRLHSIQKISESALIVYIFS